MVNVFGRSKRNEILNKTSEEIFNKSMKKIENYSIIALFLLIAAILFLSFDQKLVSGIMIIAGASMGVIIVRKVWDLNKRFQKSLDEFTSLNERKDDVIIDFSHKIREPLNNLVIIADLLMESGLQKKQKELLETYIASTNNMVTTVNELSMQSAGNLSYESRKAIRFNLLSTIQNTIELYNS
jgi:signal transduction histidine kinase